MAARLTALWGPVIVLALAFPPPASGDPPGAGPAAGADRFFTGGFFKDAAGSGRDIGYYYLQVRAALSPLSRRRAAGGGRACGPPRDASGENGRPRPGNRGAGTLRGRRAGRAQKIRNIGRFVPALFPVRRSATGETPIANECDVHPIASML